MFDANFNLVITRVGLFETPKHGSPQIINLAFKIVSAPETSYKIALILCQKKFLKTRCFRQKA